MKDKWIEVIRHILVDMDFDESSLSDEEVIEIGMGLMAPELSEVVNIKNEFAYKMFFNALIQVSEPPPEITKGVDIELMRAKLNNN